MPAHRRPRRGRSLAALTLVLGTLAAGCKPDVGGSVLLVGDSILQYNAEEILFEMTIRHHALLPAFSTAPRLGATPEEQVLAEECAEPTYWECRLASIATKIDPDAIVVELGTNDLDHPQTFAAAIDPIVSAARDGRDVPVYWINVRDDIPIPQRVAAAATVNTALDAYAAAPGHGFFEVLDYAAFAHGHPEWFADEVHPNAAGQAAFAKWLVDALEARLVG